MIYIYILTYIDMVTGLSFTNQKPWGPFWCSDDRNRLRGGLVRAGGAACRTLKRARGSFGRCWWISLWLGEWNPGFWLVMCNEENPEENPAKLWNHRMFYFLKSRLRCKVGQAARYRTWKPCGDGIGPSTSEMSQCFLLRSVSVSLERESQDSLARSLLIEKKSWWSAKVVIALETELRHALR
jgi:hypothetical protein